MTISEFAEQILFGTSLDDKLAREGSICEESPDFSLKLFEIPLYPHRPKELSFHPSKTAKHPFPRKANLSDLKQRGIVMHFFANHELLALELMALMLLRFPDAPPPFRKGLVHTMKEEQDHLRLYLGRMRDYGVSFGEIPVNDFFWKCISRVPTLQGFVAQMSLTLEQANLDFSHYYMKVFRALGDTSTSDILRKVYDDEIGHVQHGWKWFLAWKDTQLSAWEAYQQSLDFPLTPARAKGVKFDTLGRKAAGLSDEFIEAVRLYAHSKGRSPGIYYFNPACEHHIAHGRRHARMGAHPKTDSHFPTLSKKIQTLANDLETLPMFLCHEDDVVMVNQMPSPVFLSYLQQNGFSIPQFIGIQRSGTSLVMEDTAVLQRRYQGFYPWGWSPEAAKFFQPLLNETRIKGRTPEGIRSTCWKPSFETIFSKAWSCQLLREFLQIHQHTSSMPLRWQFDSSCVGKTGNDLEEVIALCQEFFASGWPHLLIKGIYGASGQNRVLVAPQDLIRQHSSLHPPVMRTLIRLLEQQGSVVVEPWLDKVIDFSFHFDVLRDSKTPLVEENSLQTHTVNLGIVRFFTNHRGQYHTALIGNFDLGLDQEVLRFIRQPSESRLSSEDPQKPMRWLLQQLSQHIGTRLLQAGYCGPVGVDMMVYRAPDAQRLAMKPIIEINPRFTMGRVALHLEKHLHPASIGIWTMVRSKDIVKAGFTNFSDFSQELNARFPLQLHQVSGKLENGVLWTTDPLHAQMFCSLLVIGSIDNYTDMLTRYPSIFQSCQALKVV